MGSATSTLSQPAAQVGGLDSPVREMYDRLFEECPDAFVQQSSGWAEAIAESGPDEPLLLVCQSGGRPIAGLPLFLYRHSLGNVINSVPQAGPLGGVFTRPGLSTAERERAYACLLQRAAELASETESIALTMITNPFDDDYALYERYLGPIFTLENFSQYIDLTLVVEEGKLRVPDLERRTNLSRNLRKAQEAGFTVDTSDDWGDFVAWYEVHQQRHGELGAAPLDWDFVRSIHDRLMPEHGRLIVVKAGDRVASAALYVHHQHVVDVFMLSMDSAFSEQSPNYLNTWFSLPWAASVGARIYNWQSSPDRISGVYRYKQQWGSAEAPYSFVTKLLVPTERIERIGLDALRQEYRGHYVVPFAAFNEGFERTHFVKGGALAARQGSS